MRRVALVTAVLGLLVLGSPSVADAVQAEPHAATRPPTSRAEDLLGDIPVTFIPDGSAGFRTAWGPTEVGFGTGGLSLAIHDTSGTNQQWGVGLRFAHSRPVTPIATGRTGQVVSYFTGAPEHWRTGLPTFGRLAYRGLWPGIDLAYEGEAGSLKYAFHLDPGADPARIGLRWQGASVSETDQGGLEIATPAATLLDGVPVAWQPGPSGRTPVAASWTHRADGTWGFALGDHDAGRPVVIDPDIVYAGYLGGADNDYAWKIAADAAGAAYLVGRTSATGGTNSFPATVGPDTTFNGNSDVVVAKLSPGGSVVYAGFVGGTDTEYPHGIEVDGSGAVYVSGETYSSEMEGFPVMGGPDTTFNGAEDLFVAKIKPDGTGLDYAGYIGGTDYEYGGGLGIDASGAAYVSGETESSEMEGFPVMGGPDTTFNGSTDAFVAKVSPSGSGLEYAGYIGGSNYEGAYGLAVDPTGNAYATGYVESTEAQGFPVLVGPDLTYNGTPSYDDVFLAKVGPTGTLLYAGYIGGTDHEWAEAVAVDGSGAAYVAGQTRSDQTAEAFPATVGPDLTYAGPTNLKSGEYDGFVAKVDPSGSGFTYLGYLGGLDYDEPEGVAVDTAGTAYVAGTTQSTEVDDGFPVLEGPDVTFNGGNEGFVGAVLPSGAGLRFLGYLGGVKNDSLADIDLDPAGAMYVAGQTESGPSSLPVKGGPQLTFGGNQDILVAKIAELCAGRPATIVGTAGKDRIAGTGKADVISALGGNDRVNGKGGADRICGDAGNDTVKGGGGKDKLYGDEGKDTLVGQAGTDTCVGGPKKDRAKGCEKERQL